MPGESCWHCFSSLASEWFRRLARRIGPTTRTHTGGIIAAMTATAAMVGMATSIKSPPTRVIRTAFTPARMTPSDDRTTVHNVLTITATDTATTVATEDTETRINTNRLIVTASCAAITTVTNVTAAIVAATDVTTIVGPFRFN